MTGEVSEVLNIITSISADLALDDGLALFSQKLARQLGVDGCAVSGWDRDSDTLLVLADYVAPEVAPPFDNVDHVGAVYPLDYYPATRQILQQQVSLVVVVDDPTASEPEKDLLKALQWTGVLMVPLLYKSQAVGLLELYVASPRRPDFSENELTLCQVLANQAAIFIEQTRLYREVEEGRLHAEVLQVIGRTLAAGLNYQRTVRNVAEFAYRLVGAQFVYVAVPQAKKGFRLVATAGLDKRSAPALHSPDISVVLSQPFPFNRVLREKRPIVVADIQQEAAQAPWQEAAKAQGWRALLAVPLLAHSHLVGVLAAYALEPNFFQPNTVAVLMSLASQAAVAIQNAELFAELEAQHEALHDISLRLVNAQEEERRRIARELHDELGQALTALKINLEVARRNLHAQAPPKLQESIHDASALAVQTLETARSLSVELHPAMLDDLGLVPALSWEIDRYEQRLGQTIHFTANLDGVKLRQELEVTLYRIITEALTNTARHAQATNIRVYIRVEGQQVRAGVEDDGVGFDAARWFKTPRQRQSLGLVSMRERAELLGGALEVISNLRQGTKVRVTLPIS